MRAFVLVGAPFVPPEEAVEWAVRSAVHAFEQGAERVSLIPVRGGNGAMEALREAGDFTPPRLDQLEEALERCLDLRDRHRRPLGCPPLRELPALRGRAPRPARSHEPLGRRLSRGSPAPSAEGRS